MDDKQFSRKTVLRAALAAGVAAPFLAGSPAQGRTLEPTPSCDDGDDPTPPQTEGPYFKPNSPQRTSLVNPGTPGTRLTVTGHAYGLDCQPLTGVLLDFWQADVNGRYDNAGFGFRGHQFTTAQGTFTLSTIVPGIHRTSVDRCRLAAANRNLRGP